MRHDFRTTRWGHSFEGKIDSNLLKAHSWSTPAVRQGDEVVWETNYGYAVGKVIYAKQYSDPLDMAYWFAEITERHLSDEVQGMLDRGEVDSPPWL